MMNVQVLYIMHNTGELKIRNNQKMPMVYYLLLLTVFPRKSYSR